MDVQSYANSSKQSLYKLRINLPFLPGVPKNLDNSEKMSNFVVENLRTPGFGPLGVLVNEYCKNIT
jgi:hypothetical protein